MDIAQERVSRLTGRNRRCARAMKDITVHPQGDHGHSPGVEEIFGVMLLIPLETYCSEFASPLVHEKNSQHMRGALMCFETPQISAHEDCEDKVT